MPAEELEIETVRGEVVQRPEPTPNLSPAQYQAALAEAAGSSRQIIAEVAGVSVSTIRSWRNQPDYRREVERMAMIQANAVAEPMIRMQEKLVTAMEDAISTLSNMLHAEDDRGQPMYGVRTRAAELLMENGSNLITNEIKRKTAEASASAGTPASGVVQLQINVGEQQSA